MFVISKHISLSSAQSVIPDSQHKRANTENFVELIESLFWDKEYGGYYSTISEFTIANDDKLLSSHVAAIFCYLYLYQLTSNDTYLGRAHFLIDFVHKHFISNITGTYYSTMTRNFSSPVFENGAWEINGVGSIKWSLLYGITLVRYYSITRNSTILSRAIELFDDIVRLTLDRAYGGLAVLCDIYILCKSPNIQGLFSYFSYNLYAATKNETYMKYFWDSLCVLNKMWDNGFHHLYHVDFSVLNSNRFPAHIMAIASLAYLLAYNLDKNTTYLERGEILINQTLFYFWDARFGGYVRVLDEDFKVLFDSKLTTIQLLTLLSYDFILSIYDGFSNILKRRISGLLGLLEHNIMFSYGLVKDADRYWNIKLLRFQSIDQFLYAYLVAKYGITEDNNPPMLIDLKTESLEEKKLLLIRIIDLESGVSFIKVKFENTSVQPVFDDIENIFKAQIPSDVREIEIIAADEYENTLNTSLSLPTMPTGTIPEELGIDPILLLVIAVEIVALAIIVVHIRRRSEKKTSY